jgi:succinyl-CoA synthetase beta subunit
MNIHEYQSKELLAQSGVAVPPGEVCSTADQVQKAAEKILASGVPRMVVKAQTHAGGRGKGTFKNGFQGGVKVCSSAEEAIQVASSMLGQVLVTKQTGAEGRLISKVLVESALAIKKRILPGSAARSRSLAPFGHGQF